MGSEGIKEEIMGLLKEKYPKCRHTFIAGDEASLPAGHLSEGISLAGYDTVVYDTSAYSFGTVLALISRDGCKRMRLGTYSAKSKVLITDCAVHSIKNG